MILQPLMGWVLDTRWKGAMANGARVYDLGAYRSAFALILGWSVLAAILISFTAETHCRQMAEESR